MNISCPRCNIKRLKVDQDPVNEAFYLHRWYDSSCRVGLPPPNQRVCELTKLRCELCYYIFYIEEK